MADYYRVGQSPKKVKRRRWWLRIIVMVIILLLLFWLVGYVRAQLQPKTVINQSKGKVVKATFDTKTRHYDMPNFGIDIASEFKPIERPPGTYNSFTWQSSLNQSDGRQLQVFEDTIPVNFAVNRALVVVGEGDRLQINGNPSDNCTTFTRDLNGTPNQAGTPAKWQGISFLCDRSNQTRNVIGTSSSDGVNVVILRSPVTGSMHKYLFAYSDQSANPDYSIFLQALQSLRMK